MQLFHLRIVFALLLSVSWRKLCIFLYKEEQKLLVKIKVLGSHPEVSYTDESKDIFLVSKIKIKSYINGNLLSVTQFYLNVMKLGKRALTFTL